MDKMIYISIFLIALLAGAVAFVMTLPLADIDSNENKGATESTGN
jgi:hypothetical protein